MKIREIIELLGAKVVAGDQLIDKVKINYAFASDLMSDVLTLDKNEILLITGLSNLQTLRTAEMSDIQVVLLVRNKKASPEMVRLAGENDMILLESPNTMFRVSGELYKFGVKPVY